MMTSCCLLPNPSRGTVIMESAAAQKYNITAIPQTILLDKEGKIIAKGLRGEELEQKLASLLK